MFYLEYFVEAVVDDRIRKTGRNVANRGTFAQHLLHLGIHKHRAARSQIAGQFTQAGPTGKVGHAVVHALGKGLDKRAAARRTGFVDFNAIDDALLHKDGFHILAADVENETHIGHHVAGGPIMGNGFDNAIAQTEGFADEVFAVAGGATARHAEFGPGNGCLFLQLRQPAGHGSDGVTVVGRIEGKDGPALGIECDNLGSGRPRVDANHHFLTAGAQLGHGQAIAQLLLLPLLQLGFIPEERLEVLAARIGGDRLTADAFHQGREAFALRERLRRKGCAPGGNEFTALWHYHFVFRKVQVIHKSFAQSRYEGKRTAAEEQRSRDVLSMRKCDDGLHGHGVKDAGSNVGAVHILGQQILDVGLAEYAAARGDGIDAMSLQGQLIEFVNRYVQQDGHLVDERTGTSGAVAVHAKVGALAFTKEDHLGIFSANVNHGGDGRIIVFHIASGTHHFLQER